MRRAEAFEIAGDDAHRGECNRQLGERGRFEHTAGNGEQLERLPDIGNGFGPNCLIGDEQRRKLGDLRERVANGCGIGGGAASGEASGTQRPGGVLCNPRQRLGEFECF